MYKKLALFMILILILGALFAPLTQSVSVKESNVRISDGNTFYVGGSGPGNHTKIQEAINNASDGDTVFVYNGTYNERIYVNRSIDLIGENKYNTIIKGLGFDNVVRIVNSSVTVQNFYINNSGHFVPDSGILIYGEINNITIQNNIITNNNIGICVGERYLYKSIEQVTIESNLINNNRYGVKLFICYNNRISNNTFIGNGIVIPKGYTRDNNVVNNTVNGKPLLFLYKQSDKIIEQDAGQIILVSCKNITISSQLFDKKCDVCIELFASQNCNVFENNISNNYYGVFCLNSDDNNIQGNLMENVSRGIYSIGSNSNTISSNIIDNSRWGMYFSESNRNSISNNSILNSRIGFYFSHSSLNKFSFNLIDNCSENGIETFFSCNFNKFLNNEIYNCRRSGIYLYGSYIIRFDLASNMNVISGNNIENNTRGIFIDEASLTKVTMNNIVRNKYGIDVISSRLSRIFKNNIFDNEIEDAFLKNSYTTKFSKNYWNGESRIHIIPGGIYYYNFWGETWELVVPLIRFDFQAVKKAYNVGV